MSVSVPARTEVLERLRSLLASLLKTRPTANIDHVPLVEMGANSLMMMELVRAVDRQLGVKIQIRQLFRELSTLDALAAHVAERSSFASAGLPAQNRQVTDCAVVPATSAGDVPATSVQLGSVPSSRDCIPVAPHATAVPAVLQQFMATQLDTVAATLDRIVAKQLQVLGGNGRLLAPVQGVPEPPQVVEPSPETLLFQQAESSSLPQWQVAETQARNLGNRQKEYLEQFTRRYCERSPGSKKLAQTHRPVLADNRASAGFRFTTKELLYPIVGQRSAGARIWDVDDNEYLDITMGFGVYLFGHNPPFVIDALAGQIEQGMQLGPQTGLAGQVADAVCSLTGAERAAFCNTGTEAVMTAMRLARTVTGRPTIALFSGSYHGHFDGTLGVARSPEDPQAVAAAPGTNDTMLADVLVLEYGDPRSLQIIESRAGELAAVLVEPVQSRRPELQPRQFLTDLAAITRAHDISLIFDEMITGFRVHPGGAQAWFGVKADIAVYGKVVGGGMPIGVVAGRATYLDALDGGQWRFGDRSFPEAETTFFAGTFNKHPLTMAACKAVLDRLQTDGPELQVGLNRKTAAMAERLNTFFERDNLPIRAAHFGSLFRFHFSGNLDLLFYHLLAKGVYVWEGRNCFLSTAHTDDDIDHLVMVVQECVEELREGGYIEGRQEDQQHPESATSFVLSEAQQQVWVQAEMSRAGSLAYNITTSLHLEGELRADVLELALRSLVERHEALRITIDGDGQRQSVKPLPTSPVLARVSLDGAGAGDDETVRRWLDTEEASSVFDLASGPLYRFTLLELTSGHHVLVMTVHHIAVDGWSVGILVRELCDLYNHILGGEPWLPEPAVRYCDYVHDREALQRSPVMGEHEAYWLGVYRDLPAPVELPTDRPRPAMKTFSCRRRTVQLPPSLGRRVLELSAQEQSTPFMTLLATYVALLSRLSGSEDLALGIPVSARSVDEGWSLVGYCTNLLPFRCAVDPESSFAQLIGQVRDTWLEAVEHQDLPLSGLIRRLDIPRDPARPPLVSMLFNLDHAPSTPRLKGLRTRWVSSPIRHAVYDLFLNAIQDGDAFVLECDANCDLYDEETVDRLLALYMRLLEVGLQRPESSIADLPLLTDRQRQRLDEWNATSNDNHEDTCLHEQFAERARRCPDAVAVVHGPRSLTYRELDQRADLCATFLRSRAVGTDTAVGICMPRSLEMIIGILAVLKAGGAYLPLDPTSPGERLRYMLTNSEAQLVLVDGEVPAGVQDTAAEMIPYRSDLGNGEGAASVDVQPHHLAYVMYTSGSTGRPKGVMVEHRNVANLVRGLSERVFDRYQGTLRVALVAPVVFDASVQQIFSALLLGHELWIVPDEVRGDGARLAQYLADNQIDVSDGTPTHLRLLVEAAGANGRALGPRHLIIGGEEMPAATARELFRRYPDRPPVITNIYGPTECCVDTTAYDLSPESVSAMDKVPIGTPLLNQRVHILDQRKQYVPIGVPGEVWIGGKNVARGYHNNEPLTAESFVDGGEVDLGRVYRTGDLARWRRDGTIDFMGRIDHQVKIRGHRIELGEIENALLEFQGLTLPVIEAGSTWERRASVQRCASCVLPADFPGLCFDDDGVCSVCREYDGYRHAAEGYFGDASQFEAVMEPVLERQRGEHECMLLYSGGKDSSYVLYRLMDMGLKVLTFTFDNGYISQTALQTIERTTSRLGIDSIIASVDDMDACFAESLSADHTVCTGCFRALTALSTKAASEREIDVVVTGLSRGQILDTKLRGLLRQGIANPEEIERRLMVFRRMYHRRNDAISRILDVDLSDDIFEHMLFVDYFRYEAIDETAIRAYLAGKDQAWRQPGDTGFCSSNCLINDVGISVHLSNRGYHNYAAPLSWDCRLGLCSRADALSALDFEPGQSRVAEILGTVFASSSPVKAAVITERIDPAGHKLLCAYLVADASLSRDALRRHLAQRLPDYMIPSQIVVLDRMPMTASGKIDRSALPEPEALTARETKRVSPRTPTEELVAGVWSEVLGCAVGRDDSFFDLGGHSISATQVVARVRDLFALELPLRLIFEHPVLADLCAMIDGIRRSGTAVTAPPLERGPKAGELPLSFSQQRLWFLEQLEGQSAAYNVAGGLRIRGSVDAVALEQAVLRIVERHETLRTSFPDRGGEPLQVVAPVGSVTLEQTDLTNLSRDQKDAEVQSRAAVIATAQFDLCAGPLLRLELLRLAADEHVLLTTMHHIISDGWSIAVFARELAALYGTSSDVLPELPIQYADYARWERRWLSNESLAASLAHWRERLGGAPALLVLPTDRPRPALQTFRGATHHTTIESELVESLRALGKQSGTTLFMSLLSVFFTLVHRYTHEPDIVVGTPVANRNLRQLEPLIGFFVNTLALRVPVSAEDSFRQVLTRVREIALDAFAHSDTPFERIVDELQPERSLSHQPLFQLMFILHNQPVESLVMTGLELEPMELDTATSKFDLTLAVRDDADGALAAEWEYNSDLFDASTINRMANHFRTLLESATNDPDRAIACLPMLSDGEQNALIRGFNQTEVEIPNLCLHELFELQVDRAPEAVAVIYGRESLDYQTLEVRANRIARLLASRGVAAGDRVAICLGRSPNMVAALLGTLKLGAAYVPMDPVFPRTRLAEMLADSGASAAICSNQDNAPWIDPDLVVVVDPGSLLAVDGDRVDGPGIPEDVAYVIYTSGSTGRPKGVEINHRSLVNFVTAMAREVEISEEDTLLAVTTVSFDIAALELFLPLIAGATLHLASAEEATDGHRLAVLIEDAQPTLMQATPATWHMLLMAGWNGQKEMTILCGGEALPGDLAQRMVGISKRLLNLYGPTETTVWSTVFDVTDASGVEGLPEPIGRAIANTRTYILTPGTNQPVPVGVPGELCIAGHGVARGYHGRPRLTAQRFVDDPFHKSGGRMYRTGDLARYRADGVIEFLGRTDDQIKLRGFRIEPSEVEAALSSHEAVKNVVVACRGDRLEERRLVAWIVPELEQRPVQVSSDQLGQWHQVWDTAYGDGPAAPDPAFDISGWRDSIHGEPIPDPEMCEWVETTSERIRALRPRRVLEIGCGTGLIMARVAPECEQYVATDFSAAALETVNRLKSEVHGLDHVQVEERAANDLSGYEPEHFDLVILNSVVQYFPSAAYLMEVLTGIAEVTRSGGAIMLGDLRNLQLLEALHAWVQLHTVHEDLGLGDLARRVANRMAEEEELLVHPALFAVLPGQVPRITRAGVQLRRGSFDNELTRYRYDAILRVGASPATAVDQATVQEWGELTDGLEELEALLRTDNPEALTVRHVPNARLIRDAHMLTRLREGDGNVADLRHSVRSVVPSGIDPESLWVLGEQLGYNVGVAWSASGDFACCDALFRRADEACDPWLFVPDDGDGAVSRGFDQCTNDPLRGKLTRRLVPDLKRHLEQALPSYMVPSAFVMLKDLPLTPNRKVDRKALPAPELLSVTIDSSYTAPASPTETRLAEIFGEVLGLPRVGARDNFFELGGHSLLATQVISRIRDEIGLEVPVRRLFEAPTVVELAQHVDALVLAASRLTPEPTMAEEREEGAV